MAETNTSDEALQKQFEEIATSSGWPKDIVSRIKVHLTSSGIDFEIPKDIQKQVDDLEYGRMGIPPKPAMRKLKGANPKAAKKKLYEESIDKFLVKTGLF